MIREGQESSDGSVGKGLVVMEGWERYLRVREGWEQGIKRREGWEQEHTVRKGRYKGLRVEEEC